MSKYISITHYVFFSWHSPAAITLSISTGIVGVYLEESCRRRRKEDCLFSKVPVFLFFFLFNGRKAGTVSLQDAMSSQPHNTTYIYLINLRR